MYFAFVEVAGGWAIAEKLDARWQVGGAGSGRVGDEVDILANEADGVVVIGGESGYILLGAVAIFGHSQIKNANCKYLAIVKGFIIKMISFIN